MRLVRHFSWVLLSVCFVSGCGPDRSLQAKLAVSEAFAGSASGAAISEIVLLPFEDGVFAITEHKEVFWYEKGKLYTGNELASKAAPELPSAPPDVLALAAGFPALAPGLEEVAVDAVDALVRPILGEPQGTRYESIELPNGQFVRVREDEIFWWDAEEGEVFAVNSSARKLLPELPSAPESVTLQCASLAPFAPGSKPGESVPLESAVRALSKAAGE
jgi:hypothetical protein